MKENVSATLQVHKIFLIFRTGVIMIPPKGEAMFFMRVKGVVTILRENEVIISV